MNTLKLTSIRLVSAVIVTASANSANAFSISMDGTAVAGEGYKSSFANVQTIDFNSGNAGNAFVQYSGLAANSIVQGSKRGQYVTPQGNISSYLTMANKDANIDGATDSVTLNFTKAIDYFGLYWGSIDSYNFIDFYRDDKLIKTFSGDDVSVNSQGYLTGVSDNSYINFSAEPDEAFNKTVLRANGIAFETDNHAFHIADAAAVPEPFTMGGSIAGLALIIHLKKKSWHRN